MLRRLALCLFLVAPIFLGVAVAEHFRQNSFTCVMKCASGQECVIECRRFRF